MTKRMTLTSIFCDNCHKETITILKAVNSIFTFDILNNLAKDNTLKSLNQCTHCYHCYCHDCAVTAEQCSNCGEQMRVNYLYFESINECLFSIANIKYQQLNILKYPSAWDMVKGILDSKRISVKCDTISDNQAILHFIQKRRISKLYKLIKEEQSIRVVLISKNQTIGTFNGILNNADMKMAVKLISRIYKGIGGDYHFVEYTDVTMDMRVNAIADKIMR